MIQIKPNANFYSLGGISVHENQSSEYQEYRKHWIELPQKFILRDFPMHLDIETSSRCNLRCTFCDKLPLLNKGQLGDMDFNLYKKIIDEGSRHKLWGVKLSYRGEPLLHKNIVEMASYAKKKGILDIYFNTNGMLLDRDMCERLMDAGLNRISISVEGADPVVFERERIGADFKVILNNIKTLLQLRRKKGVEYPKIRVQTVRLPNLDLDIYKSFWEDKSDEVAAIDYKDESHREKGLVYDWACPQPWQRMTIDWEGNIFPCNNDDLRLLNLGNIKEKTVYGCWHSDKAKEVRLLHQAGQSHKIEACDGCPWRTAQIRKLQNS